MLSSGGTAKAFDWALASTISGSRAAQQGADAVAILLCTFHGQESLPARLDSIAIQLHSSWQLWSSDDGSADGSPRLLCAFQSRQGAYSVSIRTSQQRGVASNFRALACNPGISADYYSYADQDDVWDADKLTVALAWLRSVPVDVQALCCRRTRLIDEHWRPIRYLPFVARFGAQANAFVQNRKGDGAKVTRWCTRAVFRAGVTSRWPRGFGGRQMRVVVRASQP